MKNTTAASARMKNNNTAPTAKVSTSTATKKSTSSFIRSSAIAVGVMKKKKKSSSLSLSSSAIDSALAILSLSSLKLFHNTNNEGTTADDDYDDEVVLSTASSSKKTIHSCGLPPSTNNNVKCSSISHHHNAVMIYEKKKVTTIEVGEVVVEDDVSTVSILPSLSPSTALVGGSAAADTRDRDVVLFGVNTSYNENRNLKDIIMHNYERFFHHAKTIQEQILTVEQIILRITTNNGRFVKLIRHHHYRDDDDDSTEEKEEVEVYVLDFHTARDRIIQVFQSTHKHYYQEMQEQKQQQLQQYRQQQQQQQQQQQYRQQQQQQQQQQRYRQQQQHPTTNTNVVDVLCCRGGQQVPPPSWRMKRILRDDDSDDNERYAIDKKVFPPLKKRCIREVTSSSKEKRYRQETMGIIDQHTTVSTAPITDKTKHTFEERLAQLADYKKNNGHCNVPRSYKGYRNLADWVSHMRTQYKHCKQNKLSPMTKERISALEKLDFEWKLYFTFEDRLVQLADYKQKFGDCHVPKKGYGFGNLGIWLINQRHYCKLYKENKRSSMTKERICALEKLDYKWLVEQSHVPAMISLLPQKENGDNEVVCAAPSVPFLLEVPPTDTIIVIDDEEDQIECEDNDHEFYESDGDCWVI